MQQMLWAQISALEHTHSTDTFGKWCAHGHLIGRHTHQTQWMVFIFGSGCHTASIHPNDHRHRLNICVSLWMTVSVRFSFLFAFAKLDSEIIIKLPIYLVLLYIFSSSSSSCHLMCAWNWNDHIGSQIKRKCVSRLKQFSFHFVDKCNVKRNTATVYTDFTDLIVSLVHGTKLSHEKGHFIVLAVVVQFFSSSSFSCICVISRPIMAIKLPIQNKPAVFACAIQRK